MANSVILKIPLLSTSQSAKEETINGMVDALERSMNDEKTLNFAGGSLVLPEVDLQRYFLFKVSGAANGSQLTIAARKRLFVIDNISNGNALVVTCGTGSRTVPATGVVVLYCNGVSIISIADSTIMGSGGGGATAFLGLADTPGSYASSALKVLRVNSAMNAIEFTALKLSDLDTTMTGLADGFVLTWNATTSKWVATNPATGASSDNPYWKRAVDVATTTPGDIATEYVPGAIIDGVTLVDGMSILIWQQADKAQNGIYQIDGSTLNRRSDSNDIGEMPAGSVVKVINGAVNGNKIFTVTTPWAGVGSDVEFEPEADASTLLGLSDVADAIPTDRQLLSWSTSLGGAVFIDNLIPDITGQSAKVLRVKADGSGTEWVAPGSAGFPPLTGNPLKVLRVKADASDVEWGIGLPDLVGAAGKMLTVDVGEAGASWTPVPTVALRSIITKTASATLVLAEANSYIRMNSASAMTLTIPLEATEAFPIGTEIPVRQVGAGQVTFAPVSGSVTINTAETLKLRKAGSTASLIKVAANVWDLVGDLVAA